MSLLHFALRKGTIFSTFQADGKYKLLRQLLYIIVKYWKFSDHEPSLLFPFQDFDISNKKSNCINLKLPQEAIDNTLSSISLIIEISL